MFIRYTIISIDREVTVILQLLQISTKQHSEGKKLSIILL